MSNLPIISERPRRNALSSEIELQLRVPVPISLIRTRSHLELPNHNSIDLTELGGAKNNENRGDADDDNVIFSNQPMLFISS